MSDDNLSHGETFAGHRIEGVLGRGGMGVVYRAHNIALGRAVALKVIIDELSSDRVFAERFRREAQIASAVEHPNIVPVYDAGEESGRLYLTMRLIEGTDLATVLKDGPLMPNDARRILGGIAGGLDAAHAAGLVHRDVKPANVLIEGDEFDRVYLTDFGISSLMGPAGSMDQALPTLTGTGQLLGTASYVAPEQIEEGRSTERSDIYSLGCVAFEAMTGRRAFDRGSDMATAVAHTKSPRPSAKSVVSSVPSGVDAALKHAMAVDPDKRPSTAREFIHELDAGLGGRSPTRLRRAAVVGALALVLLVGIVGVLLLSGDRDSTRPTVVAPEQSGGGKPKVSATRVSAGPIALALDGDNLWVASRDANEIESIPIRRFGDGVAETIPLESPRGLASGFNSLWAVNHKTLSRVEPDAADGQATAIEVGPSPDGVATGSGAVWVTDDGESSLTRVDPATNAVSGSTDVPPTPRSVAVGFGAVWVLSDGGKLTKVDPNSASVVDKVDVGLRPTSVAVGGGGVWVTDNADGSLFELAPGDPKDDVGQPEKVSQTAASPRGVAVGLGSVWVASGIENKVEQFSSTGERIGAPIGVGNDPADVVVAGGAVFTADFGDATVSRIQP